IVHRDVKPSNLIFGPAGVKLLDLGIALVRDEQPEGKELTSAHMLLGTQGYLAPEQRTDPHGVDCRADVFSLGCTLYFLLAGEPLRGSAGQRPGTTPAMIHRAEPVPAGLVAVLDRMVAVRPEDRFPTPRAAGQALEPFLLPVTEAQPARAAAVRGET